MLACVYRWLALRYFMVWNFRDHLQRLGPGAPQRPWPLAKARSYCQKLTASHYENFSVLSCFVPGRLLPDFRAVYAFCRWSDDLGDEVGDDSASLNLLNWWRAEFLASLDSSNSPTHPVLVALADTISRHALSPEPFLDLISAFEQDQRIKEYDSIPQLLDYCSRSANPVGRIVLHLAGEFTKERGLLSDDICTGLQLANFWQDIARDRKIGRIYLPADKRALHGVSPSDLDASTAPDNLRRLVRELVAFTRQFFKRGASLENELPFPINRQIGLFRQGGESILTAIEEQGCDTLRKRPTVSKAGKLKLMTTAVWRPSHIQPRRICQPGDALARSRAWCRKVARAQAGNFFPAFRLLPRDQFEGMCALYAFMRATDDLADEPGSADTVLAAWDDALSQALRGNATHPCHLALADAVNRFGIDPAWLRETIIGVRQDLGPVRLADRADLEAYCYKVASAVGLCCLAIWGADTPRNRELAIPAGYAMQLTNILRDIAEDKSRDRVYIPASEIERHGIDIGSFPLPGASFNALYLEMVEWNKEYYRQAQRLGSRLPPAGGAMFRGILGVYRALLRKMAADPEATLRGRASIPAWRKGTIIAGAWINAFSDSGG